MSRKAKIFSLLLLSSLFLTWAPVGAQPTDIQDQITTYCTPYSNPEPAILNLILNAHVSIHVFAYGLTSPDIVQALIDAHNRGVDVKLVIDKVQAAGTKERVMVAELKSAGVPLLIGQSIKHQLQHCKAMIFDNLIVESGSLNYSPSGLLQDNFADIITSPLRAAYFESFFQEVWTGMLKQQKK